MYSAKRAETVTGLNKFTKLHSDKFKPSSAPTDLLRVKFSPFSTNPNRVSHSRQLTGGSGPIQMVAAISKMVVKLLRQVSTTPVWATLVWLNLMVLV